MGDGHVYRLGGVQLCALLMSGAEAARRVRGLRRAQLGDHGDRLPRRDGRACPREAKSIAAVLRLADARLARYGHVATAGA